MHELKRYLKEQNIKQKDAAAALRVSETYLSKVLNGHWPVSHAFVGRVAMAYPAALPVVLPAVLPRMEDASADTVTA